jgi:hypothetical protein
MHRGEHDDDDEDDSKFRNLGSKSESTPGAGSKTARRFGFPPPPAHRLGLRARKIEELIHEPGCFT